MAILVQEQVNAAYSFILHTNDPFNTDSHGIYAEVAVGLGETLASGNQPGTPYKLSTEAKGNEVSENEVTVKGFANYSRAVMSGGNNTIVDYSQQDLSQDFAKLRSFGAKFASIASFVEGIYNGVAQDIEGVMVRNES